jgi:hypothetical protein
VIIAVPAIVPAIKDIVTVPSEPGVVTVAVVVPLEKVPRVVVNATDVPLGTALPEAFFNVAVTAAELVPSADKVDGLAASDILAAVSEDDVVLSSLTLSFPQETRSAKTQPIKKEIRLYRV